MHPPLMRNVRFGLNILLNPQDTAFPAKAGLFEAAERSKRIMCYTINQYSASLDSGADTLCSIHIRRADIRIQPIFGIIGHLDCLFFGFIGNNGKDWPENLFLKYSHIRSNAGKNSGFNEVAFFQALRVAFAANYKFRPFSYTSSYIFLYPVIFFY